MWLRQQAGAAATAAAITAIAPFPQLTHCRHIFLRAMFLLPYYHSSTVQKSEKEITKEIAAIIRQITSSVSFLPLLDQPCECAHPT